MSESITWPDLVKLARDGLASREPFDATTADLLARGIVAMDAEPTAVTRANLELALQIAPDRCLFCGTAVTPGSLIGNGLANGAMPKMVEMALRSMRLYNFELEALRAVAAAARAFVQAQEPLAQGDIAGDKLHALELALAAVPASKEQTS